MSEKIARYYLPDQNPEERYLPGVPLDDITEARWAELPEWLQIAADTSGWYRKTAPAKSTPKEE